MPGAFLAAVALSATLLVLARSIALRAGVVARPNSVVSDHVAPVALLGGTAVFAGFLTLKLFEVASGRGGIAAWDVGLVTGVVCFILLGTVDDCRPLTPSVKLVAQTAATVPALVLSGGEYGTTGLIGATLFLVLLVNAYNLVDVMDGLLCILAGPAIASLVLTPGLVPTEWKFELWVALGSVSALFLFNRPPARIYGGDAGSMTLGFLLGYIWLGLAG